MVEEDEVMDIPRFDQTNEAELPGLHNTKNVVSLDETLDNEAATVEKSATTTVDHSSCPNYTHTFRQWG